MKGLDIEKKKIECDDGGLWSGFAIGDTVGVNESKEIS